PTPPSSPPPPPLPYTTLFRSPMIRSLTGGLLQPIVTGAALVLLCTSCTQDAQPPIACTGDQHCPPPSTLLRYAAQFFPSTTQRPDRKSTRLNSSHQIISYAVF